MISYSQILNLDLFKVIIYGFYSKSLSNHHLGESVWNFFQASYMQIQVLKTRPGMNGGGNLKISDGLNDGKM